MGRRTDGRSAASPSACGASPRGSGLLSSSQPAQWSHLAPRGHRPRCPWAQRMALGCTVSRRLPSGTPPALGKSDQRPPNAATFLTAQIKAQVLGFVPVTSGPDRASPAIAPQPFHHSPPPALLRSDALWPGSLSVLLPQASLHRPCALGGLSVMTASPGDHPGSRHTSHLYCPTSPAPCPGLRLPLVPQCSSIHSRAAAPRGLCVLHLQQDLTIYVIN